MLDMPINKPLKRAPKGTQNNPKEKQARKHRIVEKLRLDTQKVIQQIIDTRVSLLLKTILGNILEVHKKLFQIRYTPEEFKKLELNSISQGQNSKLDKSQSEDNLRPRSQVNSLLLEQLLDYILVEVVVGKVTQCYYITAEHQTDAQISHVQQHIISEDNHNIRPNRDKLIDSQ